MSRYVCAETGFEFKRLTMPTNRVEESEVK